MKSEYSPGWAITELLTTYSSCMNTARDALVIDSDKEDLERRITKFILGGDNALQVLQEYDIKDTSSWVSQRAIKSLQQMPDWKLLIIKCLYRPFDSRWLLYHPMVIDRPRTEINIHMQQTNLSFVTTRQTIEPFAVVATDLITGQHKIAAVYDRSYFFPLYLYPFTNPTRQQAALFEDVTSSSNAPNGRRANLSPAFITEITTKLGVSWIADGRGDLVQTIGPEDVFHYTYAVFHSPTYRTRYAEFLKIDFPRLPLTGDITLFAALAAKGAALVDLHLLRLPGAGGVGGNGGAVILQSPGKQGVSYPQGGSNIVEKITYDAAQGRVAINTDQYFAGVGPETWAMRVGGYQPLDKWLKDRKGRVLSSDDVQHYMRVIIALRETQRIVGEIDSLIPAWPLT